MNFPIDLKLTLRYTIIHMYGKSSRYNKQEYNHAVVNDQPKVK